MVLGILVAVIAAPGLLGSQEAIRQSQSKEKREEHRARRCNLIATCVKTSMRSREIDGRPVVLRDGKLWIDTGTSDDNPSDDSPYGSAFGHPYAGYYLPYPDTTYEGLVTTITDEAPVMNWVYIDKDTYEAKYGVRADAQPNLTGPFDCTRQDRRLTFEGWEGFVAVEERPNLWALYFDRDDDGLGGKVTPGTRVLEIELSRKEKRWKKDTSGRSADQTTKRSVEVKEDTPVDTPIAGEPKLENPGARATGTVNGDTTPRPLAMPKTIFPEAEWLRRPLPAVRAMSPPPAYTVEPESGPAVYPGGEEVPSSTASQPEHSGLQEANPNSVPDGHLPQTARPRELDEEAAGIPSKVRNTLSGSSAGFTDFISAYMHEEIDGEISARDPGRPDSTILATSAQDILPAAKDLRRATEDHDPAVFANKSVRDFVQKYTSGSVGVPKPGLGKATVPISTSARQRGASVSPKDGKVPKSSHKAIARSTTLPIRGSRSMASTMTSGVRTPMARRLAPIASSGQSRPEKPDSDVDRGRDNSLKPNIAARPRPTPTRSSLNFKGTSSKTPLRRALTVKAPLPNSGGDKPVPRRGISGRGWKRSSAEMS